MVILSPGQKSAKIVPAAARVQYFPEVDDTYEPVLPQFHVDHLDGKEPPVEFMRRQLALASALRDRFRGKTVVCFTHGASIAVIAALTGAEHLVDVGEFAPCGFWKICSEDGAAWSVMRRGDLAPHIPKDPNTHAWGYGKMSAEDIDVNEKAFRRARELGPSDPPSMASEMHLLPAGRATRTRVSRLARAIAPVVLAAAGLAALRARDPELLTKVVEKLQRAPASTGPAVDAVVSARKALTDGTVAVAHKLTGSARALWSRAEALLPMRTNVG